MKMEVAAAQVGPRLREFMRLYPEHKLVDRRGEPPDRDWDAGSSHDLASRESQGETRRTTRALACGDAVNSGDSVGGATPRTSNDR